MMTQAMRVSRLELLRSYPPETGALLLLYALATVSALYLLQRYSAFPFSAESRLALFGVVAFLALGVERRLLDISPLFWLLAALVIGTGIHTYFRSDLHLAISATARFSGVLMLAPLASVLLVESKQLAHIFRIYIAIFLMALGTLLFQHWGGDLTSLTKGYIAIRGDLIRHMTVVGEPNVGGMLAVIVFICGVVLPKRRFMAALLAGCAVVCIVMSLSKAAILGLAVAAIAGALVLPGSVKHEAFLRATMGGIFGLALLMLIGAGEYIQVLSDSLLGSIKGEPSAMEDLQARQSRFDTATVFGGSRISTALTFLLGASFAGVGSAALEILGPDSNVILPHNSYVEMFLTGGLVMLGVVVALMARTYRRLWLSAKEANALVDQCALLCLIVLSCWMLVYPVIYEPVTGCLFWIILGYGNRPLSKQQVVEAHPN